MTTILLGIVYPLVVTGLAQVIFPNKANGQLIARNGKVIGSRIIGQPFTGPRYFHSRPSAAGTGYDAANSGGTNLGPTNKALITRVDQDAKPLQAENPGRSGSGRPGDYIGFRTRSGHLHRRRGIPGAACREGTWDSEYQLQQLVAAHTEGRQFGFLGEPRVNVLELNLALDAQSVKQ